MQLFPATLDDLVFEGRNQAYGAYQLRRTYGGNLASAGGITLGACLLLLLGWAAWPAAQPKPVGTTSKPLEPTIVKLDEFKIEPPKQAALAPARPAPPPARTHQAPAVATQVAPDHLVPPPPAPTAEPTETDGPVGPPTPGPTDPLASATASTVPGGPPGSTGTEAAPDTKEFVYVEKMPEFAGGQAALMRYLRDHLRYPAQALREQAEGRVFLSFVVKADGTIADVAVVKGLGYGLDEEALRVVRQMPAWTPGYQAQHAVAVRFTLPITFKIQ